MVMFQSFRKLSKADTLTVVMQKSRSEQHSADHRRAHRVAGQPVVKLAAATGGEHELLNIESLPQRASCGNCFSFGELK